MIEVGPGAAFTTAADGDAKRPSTRTALGLPADWATVRQVHGATVVEAARPGDHGEADGVLTSEPGLPVAVFTADCLGIVMHGSHGVAAVHAGWRGLHAGVVERAVAAIGDITSAVIGPHIRPCCFEVGPEVAAHFPGHLASTSWGTVSVDLAAAASAQLPVEPEIVEQCTRCGDDTFSYRRDGTAKRHAAIGWLT